MTNSEGTQIETNHKWGVQLLIALKGNSLWPSSGENGSNKEQNTRYNYIHLLVHNQILILMLILTKDSLLPLFASLKNKLFLVKMADFVSKNGYG